MWKSLSLRAYSSQTHTRTHKVFHKIFKNKIDINPSNLSSHDLRTQMVLYMINNPTIYHKNYPELLYELQQQHTIQYKKLLQYKEKLEKDLQINSSNGYMLNSLFLLGIDSKIDELLYTHRKQIRKVDEIKRHSTDYWTFKIPDE